MIKILKLLKRIVARESYHPVLTYPLFLLRVQIVRRRYQLTLRRLREKIAVGQKIKVVFMSMDTSKWKCQSIYELLKHDSHFDPVVALTMTDEDENHTPDQILVRNRLSKSYYERMGCKTIEACDPASGRLLSLKDLNADIVFYQVPWGNLFPQTVWETSRFALCCYVPYSIETIEAQGKCHCFNLDHMADFHSLLYAIFQWSDDYAKSYRKVLRNCEWAGNTFGFGHPTLDGYSASVDDAGEYVIYAPHFAFSYNGQKPMLNIGTFQWSGLTILEYAKTHPKIKWVFKPHPKLRERLVEIGYMTKDEVDSYYAAWEEIGIACYDGDYAKWFKASRSMITDCNSFLMEYMAVGQPLIHLIPVDDNTIVCPEAKKVFDTFYVARNEIEMRQWLHVVLEKCEDPQKEERQYAAREAAILGNYAGKRINDWILNELNVQ